MSSYDCAWCGKPIAPGDPETRCSHEHYSEDELRIMGVGYPAPWTCGAALHVACVERVRTTCGVCNEGQRPVCARHATRPGVACLGCGEYHSGPCVVDPPDVLGFECRGCAERRAANAVERERQERAALVERAPPELLQTIGRIVADADEGDLEAFTRLLRIVRGWQHDAVRSASEGLPIRALLPAVAQLHETGRRIEGPLERRMLVVLAEAGLAHDFVAQAELEVDVVQPDGSHLTRPTWPDLVHRHLPLAIYLDGHVHHSKPVTMSRDNEIGARLAARGWRVRRYLRWEVEQQPAMVIAAIRHELAELRTHAYALRALRAPWYS